MGNTVNKVKEFNKELPVLSSNVGSIDIVSRLRAAINPKADESVQLDDIIDSIGSQPDILQEYNICNIVDNRKVENIFIPTNAKIDVFLDTEGGVGAVKQASLIIAINDEIVDYIDIVVKRYITSSIVQHNKLIEVPSSSELSNVLIKYLSCYKYKGMNFIGQSIPADISRLDASSGKSLAKFIAKSEGNIIDLKNIWGVGLFDYLTKYISEYEVLLHTQLLLGTNERLERHNSMYDTVATLLAYYVHSKVRVPSAISTENTTYRYLMDVKKEILNNVNNSYNEFFNAIDSFVSNRLNSISTYNISLLSRVINATEKNKRLLKDKLRGILLGNIDICKLGEILSIYSDNAVHKMKMNGVFQFDSKGNNKSNIFTTKELYDAYVSYVDFSYESLKNKDYVTINEPVNIIDKVVKNGELLKAIQDQYCKVCTTLETCKDDYNLKVSELGLEELYKLLYDDENPALKALFTFILKPWLKVNTGIINGDYKHLLPLLSRVKSGQISAFDAIKILVVNGVFTTEVYTKPSEKSRTYQITLKDNTTYKVYSSNDLRYVVHAANVLSGKTKANFDVLKEEDLFVGLKYYDTNTYNISLCDLQDTFCPAIDIFKVSS